MPKLPGINPLQAIRALEKAGFKIVRQSGHIVLSNGSRFVIVPRNNPINAFNNGRDCQGRRLYGGGIQKVPLAEVVMVTIRRSPHSLTPLHSPFILTSCNPGTTRKSRLWPTPFGCNRIVPKAAPWSIGRKPRNFSARNGSPINLALSTVSVISALGELAREDTIQLKEATPASIAG